MAQMTNCCFCIKLKAAVVIISLLWLIDGTTGAVNSILILTSPGKGTNVNSYFGFVIPVAIMYGLITIGAAFGLYVVAYANTTKLLSKYSKIAYGIAAAEIAFRIAMIIVVVMYRSAFLEDCTKTIDNTSSRVEYTKDACNQGYILSLTFTISYAAVVILLSVYFAMVVSAYAYKRKVKEDAAKYPYDEI